MKAIQLIPSQIVPAYVYLVKSREHLTWLKQIDNTCTYFNQTYSPPYVENEFNETLVAVVSGERFSNALSCERANSMYMQLHMQKVIKLISSRPRT